MIQLTKVTMHSGNCILLFLALMDIGAAFWCKDHACSPPMGNLVTGRTLRTLTSCCGGPSPHCSASNYPCSMSHPASHMADDPFFHPGTWWASEAGVEEEEIRLDLEAHFCLTHLVMLFRSPRPAVMLLERSCDFGQTWGTLKLFASNCSQTFGVPDDVSHPGALCTSRYSRATPCSEGEVIFRTLGSGSGVGDPYSQETLDLLTLTNLRIRLLQPQSCPSPPATKHPSPSPIPLNFSRPLPTPHMPPFAIYTLLAGGTCLCHGHAERCLPLLGPRDPLHLGDMVCSGRAVPLQVQARCMCLHHTAGEHCEKCAPLFNDRPWRPANGSSGEPHACQKCECHGHADTCHFSLRVWQSSGGSGGGVCDNCRHNTEGRRCQRCRPGYHRHRAKPLNSPHTCTRCLCDTVGTVPAGDRSRGKGPWCHPRSGHCHCRPGVGGRRCNQCLPGHWGFGDEGCKPCVCPQNCNPFTGQCQDSHPHEVVYNIPVGGKIKDITQTLTTENEGAWSQELAMSALHHVGECICRETKFKDVTELCRMKHAYVIKATILSAHDNGSHAEVRVKVRKVLRSGQLLLSQGTHTLYPLSWTSRGCTCPVLNPGVDYLLAGPEETKLGRLLVTLQSVALPWRPELDVLVTKELRRGCP